MSISGIHGQVLEVTVVECQKLKDTEWWSRQDPYVCLEYGSTKFRTRTCTDGGKHPVFQEKFVFTLIEGLRKINVVVWNSNTVTYDDFIGSGKIQIQDVLSRGYDDRPWPLQTKTGRSAGGIKLIMHYANVNKPTSYAPSAPPYAARPTPQVSLYSTPPPASLSAYPHPATAYPPPYTAYPSSGYSKACPHPFYPPSTAAYSPYSYPPPHDPSVYPVPPYPPPSAYPPPPRHPLPYGPPETIRLGSLQQCDRLQTWLLDIGFCDSKHRLEDAGQPSKQLYRKLPATTAALPYTNPGGGFPLNKLEQIRRQSGKQTGEPLEAEIESIQARIKHERPHIKYVSYVESSTDHSLRKFHVKRHDQEGIVDGSIVALNARNAATSVGAVKDITDTTRTKKRVVESTE
ncbi:Elicitor-responsive protein 1-like protein [Drosera capensis]